jgi:hypothetical protein
MRELRTPVFDRPAGPRPDPAPAPPVPAFEGRTMRIRPKVQDGPTIWDVARMKPTEPRTIAERYAEWRQTEQGRVVFDEVARRAYRLRAAGWNRYGVKAIVESIRFDRHVSVGPDEAGFKVNNVFTALLAREVMAKHEDLDGFFETRVRKSL